MSPLLTYDDYATSAGCTLGASRWITIDQARIDVFGDVTEDHQWIHTDPVRAVAGPFGTTIAHGYLSISVIGALLGELLNLGPDLTAVNYGLNKLRFPAPVRSGSRIRARAQILSVEPLAAGLQLGIDLVGELEGNDKPACAAVAVLRIHQT